MKWMHIGLFIIIILLKSIKSNENELEDNQKEDDETITELEVAASKSDDDEGTRTLFHEQGLRGPHTYRYGYDTGKGPNRQTKYEERDNDGIVKGSYTFIDSHGKLQVVTYEAHPKYGFRAHGSFGTYPRKS